MKLSFIAAGGALENGIRRHASQAPCRAGHWVDRWPIGGRAPGLPVAHVDVPGDVCRVVCQFELLVVAHRVMFMTLM